MNSTYLKVRKIFREYLWILLFPALLVGLEIETKMMRSVVFVTLR